MATSYSSFKTFGNKDFFNGLLCTGLRLPTGGTFGRKRDWGSVVDGYHAYQAGISESPVNPLFILRLSLDRLSALRCSVWFSVKEIWDATSTQESAVDVYARITWTGKINPWLFICSLVGIVLLAAGTGVISVWLCDGHQEGSRPFSENWRCLILGNRL